MRPPKSGRFLNDFFFSAHTLSTVGYGSISPKSLGSNIVAAVESLVGVLGFAVATGLLFGRVSRPSAKIGFSERMLITPYQEIQSLQFRVVNRRRNDLMEIRSARDADDGRGEGRAADAAVYASSNWSASRSCSCR